MDIDDKFCIICYEKVGLLKYNTICSCKFYYHLDCYLEWNNVNPICLICRNPITQSQEDNSEILTAKTCVIFILIFSCIFLLVLCSTILFFNN